MIELLDYPFMRMALVAAVLTGLTAPAIGTYLVQRRLALLGDGLGHVALTGIAVGLLLNVAPLLTAVVVTVAGAVVIELLRTYAKTSADVALAMLFYGGIAGGVLIVGLTGQGASVLNTFLFGSIVTVSVTDLWIVGVLGVVVLAAALGLRPQLFAVCQDEDNARVNGLSVPLYGTLIAVLAAATIVVATRTVGLLLVSALMVVPVATAQQMTRSFARTHWLAMGLGLVAAVGGVVTSFEADTQPGPTIVIIAIALFAAAGLGRAVASLLRRRTALPSTS